MAERRWWQIRRRRAESASGGEPRPETPAPASAEPAPEAATPAVEPQAAGATAGDEPAPPGPVRVVGRRKASQLREAIEPDFHHDLVRRLNDNAAGPVLGNLGGLESTATFVTEATALSEHIMGSSIGDEAQEANEAQLATTDTDFAEGLSSLMSFADPGAIIAGQATDTPFGERRPESFGSEFLRSPAAPGLPGRSARAPEPAGGPVQRTPSIPPTALETADESEPPPSRPPSDRERSYQAFLEASRRGMSSSAATPSPGTTPSSGDSMPLARSADPAGPRTAPESFPPRRPQPVSAPQVQRSTTAAAATDTRAEGRTPEPVTGVSEAPPGPASREGEDGSPELPPAVADDSTSGEGDESSRAQATISRTPAPPDAPDMELLEPQPPVSPAGGPPADMPATAATDVASEPATLARTPSDAGAGAAHNEAQPAGAGEAHADGGPPGLPAAENETSAPAQADAGGGVRRVVAEPSAVRGDEPDLELVRPPAPGDAASETTSPGHEAPSPSGTVRRTAVTPPAPATGRTTPAEPPRGESAPPAAPAQGAGGRPGSGGEASSAGSASVARQGSGDQGTPGAIGNEIARTPDLPPAETDTGSDASSTRRVEPAARPETTEVEPELPLVAPLEGAAASGAGEVQRQVAPAVDAGSPPAAAEGPSTTPGTASAAGPEAAATPASGAPTSDSEERIPPASAERLDLPAAEPEESGPDGGASSTVRRAIEPPSGGEPSATDMPLVEPGVVTAAPGADAEGISRLADPSVPSPRPSDPSSPGAASAAASSSGALTAENAGGVSASGSPAASSGTPSASAGGLEPAGGRSPDPGTPTARRVTATPAGTPQSMPDMPVVAPPEQRPSGTAEEGTLQRRADSGAPQRTGAETPGASGAATTSAGPQPAENRTPAPEATSVGGRPAPELPFAQPETAEEHAPTAIARSVAEAGTAADPELELLTPVRGSEGPGEPGTGSTAPAEPAASVGFASIDGPSLPTAIPDAGPGGSPGTPSVPIARQPAPGEPPAMDLAAPVRQPTGAAETGTVQRRPAPSEGSTTSGQQSGSGPAPESRPVTPVASSAAAWPELPLPYAEPEPTLGPDPGEEFVRRMTVLDLSQGGTAASNGQVQRVFAAPAPATRTPGPGGSVYPAAEYSRPLETPVVHRTPAAQGDSSTTITVATVADVPGPAGAPRLPAEMPLVSPASAVQRQTDDSGSGLPPGPAVGRIMRAETTTETTAQEQEPKKPDIDIDKVTEQVWEHIRRRLRIERERVRGWV